MGLQAVVLGCHAERHGERKALVKLAAAPQLILVFPHLISVIAAQIHLKVAHTDHLFVPRASRLRNGSISLSRLVSLLTDFIRSLLLAQVRFSSNLPARQQHKESQIDGVRETGIPQGVTGLHL